MSEATASVRLARAAFGTRSFRSWLVVTALLAGPGAAVIVAGTPPADRTFVAASQSVQLLISVTAPFLGVLLASEARRGRLVAGRALLVPALVPALGLAAGFAVLGLLTCAVTVAVTGSTVPGGPWRHTVGLMVGSVVVQVVGQFFGVGFGLLIRRPVVACLLTFSPLAVWALLGAVEIVRPARDWLTPYATAQLLLSGAATGEVWAREAVVVLGWGVGFWLAGAWRLLFRHAPDPAQP